MFIGDDPDDHLQVAVDSEGQVSLVQLAERSALGGYKLRVIPAYDISGVGIQVAAIYNPERYSGTGMGSSYASSGSNIVYLDPEDTGTWIDPAVITDPDQQYWEVYAGEGF
jgi:hypothetical protein